MNKIKNVKLRVLPSTNASDMCKEIMVDLSVYFRKCSSKKGMDCEKMISRKARDSFNRAVEIDRKAFEAPVCRSIASLGKIDLSTNF